MNVYIILANNNLDQTDQRLATAQDIARDDPNATLIVSGGGWMSLPNGTCMKEAQYMMQTLTLSGWPDVKVEDQSKNTLENFEFTKKLIKKELKFHPSKYYIVTSVYHMPRSLVMAYTFLPSNLVHPVPTNEHITPFQEKNEKRLLYKFLLHHIKAQHTF